jgi:hypothetical protein
VKTLPTVLNSNAVVQPEPKRVSFVLSLLTSHITDCFSQLCKIMLMSICSDCENAVPVFFGAAVPDAFADPVFVGS